MIGSLLLKENKKKGKKKKVLVLIAARYKSCYYNTISCFKSVNVKNKKIQLILICEYIEIHQFGKNTNIYI